MGAQLTSGDRVKERAKRCDILMIMFIFTSQMAALLPEQRVVVIGESSQPQTCIKTDETALLTFFPARILLALPSDTDRFVRHQASAPWPLYVGCISLLSPLHDLSLLKAMQAVQ